MDFANVNYLAVIVAAVAGFAVGAVWYAFLFSKPWLAAVGFTEADVKQGRSALPFVFSGIALLIMAWVLSTIVAARRRDRPRHRCRPAPLAGLHGDHHRGELRLCRPEAGAHGYRCRALAGRRRGDGRDHRRLLSREALSRGRSGTGSSCWRRSGRGYRRCAGRRRARPPPRGIFALATTRPLP